MTTKQHRIITLNGNEYILFDLSAYNYPGIFAIGTEDDVFHQTGYAAVQNGEVWRKGQYLMDVEDLGDTGKFWSEPEEGLNAIWERHGLPTTVRPADESEPVALPSQESIERMSAEEALAELQRILKAMGDPTTAQS